MSVANLGSIDVNLLVALDVLLEVRSPTVAGRRLAVSQSAMSHKLRALREIFDDPLLVVRRGSAMEPTDRARALQAPLRAALEALDALVEVRPAFDPSRDRRVFSLSGPDWAELLFMPWMMRYLAERGPNIVFDLRGWTVDQWNNLEAGELDGLFTAKQPFPAWASFQPLLEERFVCLLRRDHPLLGRRGLTLKRYLAARHVVLATSSRDPGLVESVLQQRGERRTVGLRVSSFATAVRSLLHRDLVLTTNTTLAQWAANEHPELVCVPHPLPLPRLTTGIVWHKRFDGDPGHRWLRELVATGAVEVAPTQAHGVKRLDPAA